jgi:hypothetical protein
VGRPTGPVAALRGALPLLTLALGLVVPGRSVALLGPEEVAR